MFAMTNLLIRERPLDTLIPYLLLSLRDPISDKRVALMGLRRSSTDAWELKELSGPCNRPVPGWVEPISDTVLEMVRQADEAQRAMQELLRTVAQRADTT